MSLKLAMPALPILPIALLLAAVVVLTLEILNFIPTHPELISTSLATQYD